MAKRAVLIGCNYPGSADELMGCVNDAFNTRTLLMECYGFEEENITMLVDTDDSYKQPTGANIKSALLDLVALCQQGDTAFVHFSGHGLQWHDPNDDFDTETDKLDECIVPIDGNLIFDDDLRTIFSKMVGGTQLTMVSDSCHSGTLLDHPEQQISGPNDGEEVATGEDDVQERGILASEAGVKARTIPVDHLCSIIATKLDREAVTPEDLSECLVSAFGPDSSKRTFHTALKISEAESKTPSQEGLLAVVMSLVEAESSSLADVAAEARAPLSMGVLISGCMANEYSYDFPNFDDPSLSFGLLSNCLQKVVREHKEQQPDVLLTNDLLVWRIRQKVHHALAPYTDESGAPITQSPCLECVDSDVQAEFVGPYA